VKIRADVNFLDGRAPGAPGLPSPPAACHNPIMEIFDRNAVRRHRDRAARGFAAHDFLVREVADRLADRLDDVARVFPLALDLGCHTGELAQVLGRRGGIRTLVQCDLSPRMAARAAANGHPTLCADEERLPFAPGTFDLVLSCLSLHWVNDLPGALIQIRRALKPDGLFVAALAGLGTLEELRQAFAQAELAEEGGASPRVSPFADLRDLGALLTRAGFVLPVAETETITISYADPMRLFADLRGMGETNAVAARRKRLTRRATLLRALHAYQEAQGDPDGRLPASVEVVTLTAWAPSGPPAPSAAQPRPAPQTS